MRGRRGGKNWHVLADKGDDTEEDATKVKKTRRMRE